MVMDYRYKFNNVLSIINTDISAVRNELLEIKAKFLKKESGLSISKDIINKVIHQMKRATKNIRVDEQYTREEHLEIFRILKTVNDDATEKTNLEAFKMTGAPTNLDETELSHCLKVSSTGQKEH